MISYLVGSSFSPVNIFLQIILLMALHINSHSHPITYHHFFSSLLVFLEYSFLLFTYTYRYIILEWSLLLQIFSSMCWLLMIAFLIGSWLKGFLKLLLIMVCVCMYLHYFILYLCFFGYISLVCYDFDVWMFMGVFFTVTAVDSGIKALEFLGLQREEHLAKDLTSVALNHYHQVSHITFYFTMGIWSFFCLKRLNL